MAKTVFETEMTLYSCLVNNYYEAAADILDAIRQKHPEFEQLTWSVSVSSRDSESAQLYINVSDPAEPSARETFNLIACIILVMGILALLLYVP